MSVEQQPVLPPVLPPVEQPHEDDAAALLTQSLWLENIQFF